MKSRIKRLLETMKISENQAVLLHNPSNMFYVSGYTGEGMLFLSAEEQAVVTDFRYTEQAERQTESFQVYMTDREHPEESFVGILREKLGIGTIFYEDNSLTVRHFTTIKDSVPGVEWRSTGGAAERLREIKDDDELALIQKACKITGDAFEGILPKIKAGMTEREIAFMLEYDMRILGADTAAFTPIVAAGVNGSLPHAVASDYRICPGDMITLDFGAKVGGYCADMTRTIALEEPGQEMKKIYRIVLEAQQRAQDAVAAGKDCRGMDAVARAYIDSQGYEGRFGHGLGHSLGIDIHEDPRFSTSATGALVENQVMTVEPGIYLPGVGGVRIENTVVVTKDGCKVLTLPTRDMIVL
ncbi:MAG: Xaa-Pro peptidase family protein [Clostridia bacterium]|nr:Xaa-Pro peptidase family protein [Clostridia bacterium]